MPKNASYICPECGDALLRGDSLPRCPTCHIRMEYAGNHVDFRKIQALPRDTRLRMANTDEPLG